MPRRKCCEHPTRHANSTSAPKGLIPVSAQLLTFLASRYSVPDIGVRWLCPRCHTSESKEMKNQRTMETNDHHSSSGNDLSTGKSSIDDDNDEINNQEDDDLSVDNAMEGESINGGDDDGRSFTNDEETGSESMDEEPGNIPYDLAHQQDEAMQKLSSIFQLFNINPIHDK